MVEAQRIMQSIQDFSVVSGQMVGPQKSFIWFSSSTLQADREEISDFFMVPTNSGCSSYLGAPIETSRLSFDFLIEKFSNKFQMWKSNLLSHAGRLVLIHSVLQALPIYYMATTRIPKSVINEITSIIRRFFWGKVGRQLFLAYVAWDKITVQLEEGGLGIRDLDKMNEALLAKFLWRIASSSEALWVQVVKAKYMPKSDLWHSKRTYRCTNFWRSLMNLRVSLEPCVKWSLGNGKLCSVFAQPWFKGALEFRPSDEGQRLLRTIDLLDSQTGNWNLDQLVNLFGYTGCMEILTNVKPPVPGASEDRFMFKLSNNGSYSVKAGYNYLKGPNQNMGVVSKEFWSTIWHRGDVLPRIRLFLWKLLHRALPLASFMYRRFPNHSPCCATCGGQLEDALHLLHLCPFSRACLFAGPLSIRIDNLEGSFEQVLQWVSGSLDDEQWLVYVNSAWALWRCRNDRAYAGKQPNFQQYMKYLSLINWESNTGAARGFGSMPGRVQAALPEVHNEYSCYTDGSWIEGWQGDIGLMLWHKEELMVYKSKAVKGCCSLQVEAAALKEAISLVLGLGIKACSFFTDCLSLVEICSSQHPPMAADWRAFDEILEIWSLLRANKFLVCVHVQRSQIEMADNLAKKGRINGWDYTGYTLPCFTL